MKEEFPLQAWFLGTKAENGTLLTEVIEYVLQDYMHWRRNYFPEDKTIIDRKTRRSHEPWIDSLSNDLEHVLNQLKADYPFYSPRYLAHMTSETALPGMIGYFAGMLYNPNNVSHEAAPITIDLELEVGAMVAEMLGFDKELSWSHITSGGTLANLEALWAARQNQLNALAFRSVCDKYDLDFQVQSANGSTVSIRELSQLELIGLKTSEQIAMPDRFVEFVNQNPTPNAINELLDEVKNGEFSVAKHGVVSIYSRLQMTPVILVSEAAHYSIKKVANLLGLGESHVVSIPVDDRFRVNADLLEEKLFGLSDDQVCMAVVGILGTTEEGAIDPVDHIVDIRAKYERERNRSFWFHLDAAWGGYLRTMNHDKAPLSLEVKKAISYSGSADSITIDPHKMGYIPYPAGMINFRDRRTVLHAHQKAPYITQASEVSPFDTSQLLTSVGPYIVEGSKPGAAAAATWLTHKTIPLDETGHGRLVTNGILEAQRFFKELSSSQESNEFELIAVNEPDTNVVCYLFKLTEPDLKLQNQLNESIFETFSLQRSDDQLRMPYRQDFFVSHTHFLPGHYPYRSLHPLLQRLNVSQEEYEKHGVFVLRSVFMNPWLIPAQDKGQDFIKMLIDRLTQEARQLYTELSK